MPSHTMHETSLPHRAEDSRRKEARKRANGTAARNEGKNRIYLHDRLMREISLGERGTKHYIIAEFLGAKALLVLLALSPLVAVAVNSVI